MIMVGVIEEGSKIVVPAAVLLINRRIGWPGAVVLGVSSGAGFATLETMGYGFAALLNGVWPPSTARCYFVRCLPRPDISRGPGCRWEPSGGFGARPTAPVPSLSPWVSSVL